MTRSHRLGMLALAVLVAAFVLLRPHNDDPEPQQQAAPSPTATPSTATPADADAAGTSTADRGPLLTAGREQRIEVRKGDRVRLRARSDAVETLHVHGYDLLRELGPGETVSLAFDATIEGIFEIEFEGSEAKVGSLVVEP